MKSKESNFPGTEGSMYASAAILVQNGLNNMDAIAAVDATYTPAYFQSILANAEAARAMPNNHQRQSITTEVYNATCGAADACCSQFMELMFFVRRSFPADAVETKKKNAGGEYYVPASHYKWSAVSELNTMMTTFIDSNSAALLAGGMPAGFRAACETTNAAFATALGRYTDNKTNVKQQAAAKTAANNAVYAQVIALCAVGKFISNGDSLLKEQFTYSAVLRSTRRPGKTGFRFDVTDAVTNAPIAHAHLSFTNSTITGTTNEKGICKVEMPDGKYSFMMAATGYTTIIGKVATIKGTMRHPKIKMKAGSGVVDTTPSPKRVRKEKEAL